MTKIVINSCYGGFSLSKKGLYEYAKRKGIELFFYESKPGGRFDENVRVGLDGKTICYHAVTKDLGEEATDKELNDNYYSRDIDRSDPDLVAVVEELGEESFGHCAKLKIVEIPDDVEWEIDEYDGYESIHECHRSWG